MSIVEVNPFSDSSILGSVRQKLKAAVYKKNRRVDIRSYFSTRHPTFQELKHVIRNELGLPTHAVPDPAMQKLCNHLSTHYFDDSISMGIDNYKTFNVEELQRFIQHGSHAVSGKAVVKRAMSRKRSERALRKWQVSANQKLGHDTRASKEELIRIFSQYDPRRSGLISLQDFKRAVRLDLKFNATWDFSDVDCDLLYEQAGGTELGALPISDLVMLMQAPIKSGLEIEFPDYRPMSAQSNRADSFALPSVGPEEAKLQKKFEQWQLSRNNLSASFNSGGHSLPPTNRLHSGLIQHQQWALNHMSLGY